MSLSRRDLLRLSGLGLGATAFPVLGQVTKSMPKRKLGKMGWEASIYAVGTAEIPGDEEAIIALNQLLEGGVNYIDTAPSYMGTRSEKAIGIVMKKRRKEVFLATKTLERSADGAYAEVKASLERLQTDHVNLLQVHAVNDTGTLDQILAKGGAIEGLERAKKDGLIRHIGITGHTRPEVILEAPKKYPFNSFLVPVSALDKHIHDWADEVLPAANKLGISIVGMKSLKGIERATGGKFEAEPLLRYSLSLPISTLTIGLRRGMEVGKNLDAVRAFKKMSSDEMAKLEADMKQHANVETLWWKRR
ncbi:MAG: aldo/keto reductase [Fimbriimonadaceae bacterium]|nr:aldo/keto reductase [Fimbriimonadaceae bacterium]